jgi:hypothetical protein
MIATTTPDDLSFYTRRNHSVALSVVRFNCLTVRGTILALTVCQGVVEGRCIERHTHVEFPAFLKVLYREYPGE